MKGSIAMGCFVYVCVCVLLPNTKISVFKAELEALNTDTCWIIIV